MSKQTSGSSAAGRVFNAEKKVKGGVVTSCSTASQEIRGSFSSKKMGEEKSSNPGATRSESLSPLPLTHNFVCKFPRPRHNLLARPGYTCAVPSPWRTT